MNWVKKYISRFLFGREKLYLLVGYHSPIVSGQGFVASKTRPLRQVPCFPIALGRLQTLLKFMYFKFSKRSLSCYVYIRRRKLIQQEKDIEEFCYRIAEIGLVCLQFLRGIFTDQHCIVPWMILQNQFPIASGKCYEPKNMLDKYCDY